MTRLYCEECGFVEVSAEQPRPRRCLGCDKIYRHAFRVKQKSSSVVRVPNYRFMWSTAEDAALRAAAAAKCSYAEATLRVNAVPGSPGRSLNAVRMHAHEYGIKGLQLMRYRGGGKRYWTPERLMPIYAAVRELGPRRAAYILKLSPNVVAGILSRYPLPAEEE